MSSRHNINAMQNFQNLILTLKQPYPHYQKDNALDVVSTAFTADQPP
jgi:hypothetical protein